MDGGLCHGPEGCASVRAAQDALSDLSTRDAVAAERARRTELPERLRDRDRAAVVLEVLHQRDHRPRGHGGAVQRRDGLELAVAPGADPEAPRLVVRRVGGRGQLPVALLAGEPAFDVVLLRRRRAEVAGRDVHDAVREAELLDQRLLDLEQVLVLGAGALGDRVDELLLLEELMAPELPARGLAWGARLAAEVRRV